MRLITLFCFYALVLQMSYAQELASVTIPSELKKNANAVIRNSTTNITILAKDKMVVNAKQVITVLNPKGNAALDTYLYYSDDSKITNISLTIFNDNGKEIKAVSKSKFIDVNAADGFSLYNDDRLKYIEFTPNVYPYTAVFEYEYKTASTAAIPKWYPIPSYDVSVQNSSYNLYNPKQLELRQKTVNFDGYTINTTFKADISYSITNQAAIKYESNSDYYYNVLPHLLVASNHFVLRGVEGQANDWKSFGKWMHDKLLTEKTLLNPQTINKAKALVKDAKSPMEKAQILYNYMQDKTRYISVQIGIGGWQPVVASEVDKLSYGDCKGLTIYMKALLDAVDIPSYYTIVYAGKKRHIDPEFASIQGNHAILNIPNGNDDVWLECTSQTLPFGFLGDFTDDRDVLVITPQGGVIKHTPSYKNNTNLLSTKAEITLNPNGDLQAKVTNVFKGLQYNNTYDIATFSDSDLDSYYKNKRWKYINNLEVETVKITDHKDTVSLTENLEITINDFATISEDNYIFTLNALNRHKYIPKRHRNRQFPFLIKHGYKDIIEYTIHIPEGYNIMTLPEDKEISSSFGTYNYSIKKIDEQTLLYTNSCSITEGKYSKEDYKNYRQFRKQIAKEDNLRLILKKLN